MVMVRMTMACNALTESLGRVQLEEMTWLHFAELEVFGTPGAHRRIGKVDNVFCGQNSMAVVMRPTTDRQ
jgi:hypothetical protein